ncbi:MAG: hypothetical protein HZB87_04555 [Desulfatitalea sp.]|nr:hypothetical protein [Desulfatitalea sp.]
MLPDPQVELPEAPVGEWNAIDTRTSSGLFAYRSVQAAGHLDLPDFGGGDLNAEQRREVLLTAVSFHKPLAALCLFLGVVALEDFVRDLVARMADNPELLQWFPQLANFRSQPKSRTPDQAFRRLDTDPAGVVDPEEINSVFQRAIGVSPIPVHDYWHLRDLALLRHTVAHHAAVIRHVDVPRFRHFRVQPGRVINPSAAFVKAELQYLYRVGRDAEASVRDVVFRQAVADAGPGWSQAPDARVVRLIEFFAYFGYIESTTVPVGYSEPGTPLRQQQEREAARIRASLLAMCIGALVSTYGP